MAADQATLETLLAKVPRMSMAVNMRLRPPVSEIIAADRVHGRAPRLKVSTRS